MLMPFGWAGASAYCQIQHTSNRMWKKANFTYSLLWIYIGIDCDGKHGQRGGERERRERENGVSV